MKSQKKNGRVLVADHNNTNRVLLSVELSHEGFEVKTTPNGIDCLKLASKWSPEVILLSYDLPGTNGIETCNLLRKNVKTEYIPVLMMLQNHDEKVAVKVLDECHCDVVVWPISVPGIIARIKNHLEDFRVQSELRNSVMFDTQTGVYTKKYLFDAMRRAVKAIVRGPGTLSCLIIDIDHFKTVNDTLGKKEGDRVLKEVADKIRSLTRETDIVARIGGEEFAVLLQATDREGTLSVAEKIMRGVDQDVSVTVSIGAALMSSDGLRELMENWSIDGVIHNVLNRADAAMYTAKECGRNRVVMNEPQESEK